MVASLGTTNRFTYDVLNRTVAITNGLNEGMHTDTTDLIVRR